MKTRLQRIIILISVFCSRCAALRNPGSPDQSFDEDKDIQVLEQHYGQPNAITNFYAGPQTPATRNEFISGRLTLINAVLVFWGTGNCAWHHVVSGTGVTTRQNFRASLQQCPAAPHPAPSASMVSCGRSQVA